MSCGFLEYVADIKDKGHARLFPLLSFGGGRQLTATFSQWFGRHLQGAVKITDPRKVFYSFRHGFKDACCACGIPKEHHDALTGHSSRDVGDGYGVKRHQELATRPSTVFTHLEGVATAPCPWAAVPASTTTQGAVTVEVKTGKRRVIECFLSPLMQVTDESLRER